MLEFVVFAVTIIVFLIVAVIYLMPGGKRVTTIPGPEPIDTLEGNLPDISSCGSIHEFLLDLHERYGAIASFWWGPKLAVSIGSAELFKEHSKAFDRPADFYELFQPLIGEGSIQFANGAEGRRRHAAYAKCFSDKAVKEYYSIFQKFSEEFVKKWSQMSSEEHLPLRQYSMAYAIKAILNGTLGRSFSNDAKIHQIRAAYEFVWNEMEERLITGMPEPSTTRMKRFDQQKEILYGLLRDAYNHRIKNPPGAGEYLAIDAVVELDLTEMTALNDLVSMIVGGFHTTGLLLTWALYFIASHPDVQTKLYKEIKSVLGKKNVDMENLKDLVYLRQVIDETMRCSVLAPYAARVQDFDTELGGHKIPAGTPVIQALGVTLMDPAVFPEPDKFDPERFSAKNSKNIPSYGFQPFGFAGKRACPGYRFSMVEATVLLTEVIRKFKVSLIEGQVVTPIHGLVTTPKEEIWVTVENRD